MIGASREDDLLNKLKNCVGSLGSKPQAPPPKSDYPSRITSNQSYQPNHNATQYSKIN